MHCRSHTKPTCCIRTSALEGDFNHDGTVDAADYVVWRKSGIHGQQGYDDWRANFGNSTPGFGLAAAGSELPAQVPEPGIWIIMAIGVDSVSIEQAIKVRDIN